MTMRPPDERVQGEPSLRVATVPEPHKDVDDLLRSEDGPAKFEAMVNAARPAPSWMIDHLDTRHDLSSPNGAAAATEDMLDLLIRQHPVARFRYARELSTKLGVPLEAVSTMLKDALLEREVHWRTHPFDKPATPRYPNRFPGLTRVDRYGETACFDCPRCDSPDSAKASKLVNVWHCVACDASGKATDLKPTRNAMDAAVVDV